MFLIISSTVRGQESHEHVAVTRPAGACVVNRTGRMLGLLTAVAVLAVPACARSEQGRPSAAASQQGAAATTGPSATATPAKGGADQSVSTTVQARLDNLRLVRSGTADLALQFEFANTGSGDEPQDSLTPAHLGMDPLTHVIAFLVDLPRGTGYATQRAKEANPAIDFSQAEQPRASASTYQAVKPGQSGTVTLVYPAPPAETTSMLVLVDGFLPIEVKVQPAGAAGLKDDPVLHSTSVTPDELFQPVQPVICETEGAVTAAGKKGPSSFRLPSDALFAFGSAALAPPAAAAIDALVKQVTDKSGTVTIAGHTDSVGSDADNQKLSEARAAAAKEAVAAKLGTDFEYKTVGFGETKPVAPNANPDGSDNPDGRAQNRRVEITIDTSTGGTAVAPPARDEPNTSLDGSALVPEVRGVKSLGGYTLAEVAVRNTGGEKKDMGYLNDPNRRGVSGIRADAGGELSINTSAGNLRPCAFGGSWWGLLANGSGGDDVPAGGTVVQWALLGPVPADQKSVNVVVGGYSKTFPAPVTAR